MLNNYLKTIIYEVAHFVGQIVSPAIDFPTLGIRILRNLLHCIEVARMTFWRQAGLNYVQYSSIAARVVRRALKPELANDAAKREVISVKFRPWKDGKPEGESHPFNTLLLGYDILCVQCSGQKD